MRKCPNCSSMLTPMAYEGFDLLRCGQCHGYLAALNDVEIIKRVARNSQDELKAEAMAGFHGSNTGRIKCPRCHMSMHKQTVRMPALTLEIDICTPCALAWFDGGELALVQLDHEARTGFADAQELKRRMEELESSPERKAAFEANLAKLPDDLPPVEAALGESAEEALEAIIRDYMALLPRRTGA